MSTNKNMKVKDFGKTKVVPGKMPENYKLLDQLRKDRRKLKTK